MYDTDVFQMCQISVVQIFIEGGEGASSTVFAQQIDLRGKRRRTGHPELAGICFGHRRRGNRRFLDADKGLFMFVEEVRMMPHCTKEIARCIRQAADRTLSPMEAMRTASPF